MIKIDNNILNSEIVEEQYSILGNDEDTLDDKDNSPRFKLEIFEGPLDLLLALISKNKVNIYDIPIAMILEQYMEYIHQMELFNMEVASSFIVMASQLMLIKSRLLLPRQDEQEEDPRKELVDMLLEYQRAKKTAEVLHERELTYWGRYEKPAEEIEIPPEYNLTHELELLKDALRRAFARLEDTSEGLVEMEANIGRHLNATRQVSVDEKITYVIDRLKTKEKGRLDSFFEEVKSVDEVVATFLALLELIKCKRLQVIYHSDDYADCDLKLCDVTVEDLYEEYETPSEENS